MARRSGLSKWSIRRTITASLIASYLMVLPLVGLVLYRLNEVRTHAPVWARLAEASQWLSVGAVCNGAASSTMAKGDLQRWHDALGRLTGFRGAWINDAAFAGRMQDLLHDVDATLREPAANWAGWVSGHCQEASTVAGMALKRAISLGLDPSSRGDRYEDLAVRDVVTYGAVWLLGAILLLLVVPPLSTRPIQRLVHVTQRVADGDLNAEMPEVEANLRPLAHALRRVLEQVVRQDRAKGEKIVELRDLVRRLLEVLEQPVLVVSREHRLDYLNGAAARAFGEDIHSLEGVDLRRMPGGDAVIDLVDSMLQQGTVHGDAVLSTNAAAVKKQMAHLAVVRDPKGDATRVVIVLAAAEGAWWRKLWKAAE